MAQSFFDTLASLAHQAGTMAKQGTVMAREAYKNLEPSINAALEAAKTVTDKDRRAAAIAQLKEVSDRVVATGSSQLKSVLTQMQEGFNGVPSDVAAMIATYGTLAEAAEAKGALGLPEMIACGKQIDVIKEKLKQDPKADVAADGVTLDALIRTAGAAVSNFASDAPSVNALLVSCQSTVSDIILAQGDLSTATAAYLAKIKDATAPAPISGLPEVSELEARLTEAQTDSTAGNYAAAAIKLSNFGVDAAARLAATQKKATELQNLTEEPARTLRLLRLLRDTKYKAGAFTVTADSTPEHRASAKDMVAAYEAAKKLLLEVPCDVPAARQAFDLFEQLAR